MKKITGEQVLREIRAFLIRIIIACVIFIGIAALIYFDGEVLGYDAAAIYELLKNSLV